MHEGDARPIFMPRLVGPNMRCGRSTATPTKGSASNPAAWRARALIPACARARARARVAAPTPAVVPPTRRLTVRRR